MAIENILEKMFAFDSIFINLLNASISACWLVGGVLLFRLAFRKAPKWLNVVLWAVVAVRLICPVPLESSLSLVPTAEPLPTEVLNIEPHKGVESTTMEIINNPVYSEYVDSSVPVDVESFQWDAVLGGLVWVYGAGAMLLYALFSYLYIYLKVRQSMHLRDNIYLCDRIDTPFIFGIIRPKIYLPSLMYEEDRSFVLAHERAHLKRRDHLWKPLGFLILSVYWFNPVIWLSYILLCRDIELACDEKVIKEMGAEIKKPYSMALINCSVPRKMITACPVAFGETGVKKRIKAVLSYKRPALWLIVIAVITSVILAVCFATSPKKDDGTSSEKSYLIQTDEGEEMFRFGELLEYSEYFTVYKGKKSYFKATPGAGRSTVLNFFNSLSLERLPDMKAEGLTHSGKIEVSNSEGNIDVVFCDGFSKMFILSTEGSTVTESSLYAVDMEKVKSFFEEEDYIKQGNIWECNFASSAYGHGSISFFPDAVIKISEEPVAKGGRIEAYTSDEHGDGYMWIPEIAENGVYGDAELTFEGIVYGEKTTFTVNITKVGENDGLSTYYMISGEDTVIGGYGNGYEYSFGKPQITEENNKWYCNPNLSHTVYSSIDFSLPAEYKLVSAECSKGEAEIENIYYLEPDGEKQVSWHPDFDTYLTDESYEIIINALKKGEKVSFTVKVIGQDKSDEMGGRVFAVEFLNCIAVNKGWATYEIHETDNTTVTDLDTAVSKAILDLNSKSKWLGECPAEGHIIFGTSEKKDIVSVYMLERFSSYGFVDGWFISVGGHSIPCVMRFEKKDGQYIFMDVEYAQDGSNYTKSIKRMFPKVYEHRVHNLTKKEQESIDSQRKAYAEAYLDSIGREAPIGDYKDIDRVLLTDAGVSVDVSNKLLGLKVNYETGVIGWHEVIEDGVRYVYRTSYAQTQNKIVYTKEKYGTSEIVEKLEVDSLTGEVISAHSSPAYAAFFDAEVLEKTDTAFTVKPLENTKERKYGEKITVYLENIPEEYLTDLYEGLYVRIYYDGVIGIKFNDIHNASAVYPMADILNIGTSAPAASEKEPTTAVTSTTMPQNMVVFDAEIIEVYKDGKTVLVEPAEDSNERKSADKIQVSLKDMGLVGRASELKKGTKVRIYYDGMIAETYPAQIREAYDILLLSELSDVSGKVPTTKAYTLTPGNDSAD